MVGLEEIQNKKKFYHFNPYFSGYPGSCHLNLTRTIFWYWSLLQCQQNRSFFSLIEFSFIGFKNNRRLVEAKPTFHWHLTRSIIKYGFRILFLVYSWTIMMQKLYQVINYMGCAHCLACSFIKRKKENISDVANFTGKEGSCRCMFAVLWLNLHLCHFPNYNW